MCCYWLADACVYYRGTDTTIAIASVETEFMWRGGLTIFILMSNENKFLFSIENYPNKQMVTKRKGELYYTFFHNKYATDAHGYFDFCLHSIRFDFMLIEHFYFNVPPICECVK